MSLPPIIDVGAGVGIGNGMAGGAPSPLDQETGFTDAKIGSFKLGEPLTETTQAPSSANTRGCGNTLLGIIRDFKDEHPDFQAYLGAQKGVVQDEIGPDRKPVYAPKGSTSVTTSPEAFAQWYRSVEGVNAPYLLKIRMAQNGDRLTFHSDAFFPLDGQAFGNQGRNRNFHFTFELHTEFIYTGGEKFRFVGDDDLWVFINGRLAVDLGGVHGAEEKEISLDEEAAKLNIEKGGTYTLELFHAERHTSESNFRVDTSLKFVNCGTISPQIR